MAKKLMPLVGEVIADEVRRLTGRPRPSRYPSSPTPARPPAAVEKPPPSSFDPWAAEMVGYAERTLAEETPPSHGEAGRGLPFERVDLGLLTDAIAHIVRESAPVREDDLTRLIRGELLLGDLPANYERLLGRFVWSAKGRRLIDLDDGAWVVGHYEPSSIPQLEGHSLDSLAQMAGELQEEDEVSEDGVFRALLADLVGDGERAPRIVAIAAGAAIGLARRRGDLPRDRWGQQSLVDASDE